MEDIVEKIKAIPGVVVDTVTDKNVSEVIEIMVNVSEEENWFEALVRRDVRPVSDSGALKYIMNAVLGSGLGVILSDYPGAKTLFNLEAEPHVVRSNLGEDEMKGLMRVYRTFLRYVLVATLDNEMYCPTISGYNRDLFPFLRGKFAGYGPIDDNNGGNDGGNGDDKSAAPAMNTAGKEDVPSQSRASFGPEDLEKMSLRGSTGSSAAEPVEVDVSTVNKGMSKGIKETVPVPLTTGGSINQTVVTSMARLIARATRMAQSDLVEVLGSTSNLEDLRAKWQKYDPDLYYWTLIEPYVYEIVASPKFVDTKISGPVMLMAQLSGHLNTWGLWITLCVYFRAGCVFENVSGGNANARAIRKFGKVDIQAYLPTTPKLQDCALKALNGVQVIVQDTIAMGGDSEFLFTEALRHLESNFEEVGLSTLSQLMKLECNRMVTGGMDAEKIFQSIVVFCMNQTNGMTTASVLKQLKNNDVGAANRMVGNGPRECFNCGKSDHSFDACATAGKFTDSTEKCRSCSKDWVYSAFEKARTAFTQKTHPDFKSMANCKECRIKRRLENGGVQRS